MSAFLYVSYRLGTAIAVFVAVWLVFSYTMDRFFRNSDT